MNKIAYLFKMLTVVSIISVGAVDVSFALKRASDTEFSEHETGREAACPDRAFRSLKDGEVNTEKRLHRVFRHTFFVNTETNESFIGPFKSSEVANLVPQLFSRVTILSSSDDGEKWLIAWKQDNNTVCTWIGSDALLGIDKFLDVPDNIRKPVTAYFRYGPIPLKVRDIEKLSGQNPNSKNTLTVRVVLSNLNVEGEEIPVYNSPTSDQPNQGGLKLFETYTVYDWKLGKTRGRQDGIHYLIGKDFIQNNALVGWVSRSDLYEWNSRMAIFPRVSGLRALKFDDGTGEFETSELLDYIPFQEFNGRSRQRYPVLRSVPDAPKIKELADSLPSGKRQNSLEQSKLVEGYQIALPTENCNQSGTDCVSAEEFEQRRLDYQKRVDSLNNLDVLILMDATESMRDYFPSTAQAVEKFAGTLVEDLTANENLSIRVGVNIYGDYQNGRANLGQLYYKTLVPWFEPNQGIMPLDNMGRFANRFEQIAPKDKEKDKPEGSLAALIKSASEQNWRDNAGVKFIIHLADHGSRKKNQTSGENGSQLKEQVDVGDVFNALDAKKIFYIPIAVLGKKAPEDNFAKNARSAFFEQAASILEMSKLDETIRSTYNNTNSTESNQSRRDAVYRTLNRMWNDVGKYRTEIQFRENCIKLDFVPDGCKYQLSSSNDSARLTTKLDESMDLSLEQIQNIYARRDNVNKIWVRPVANDAAGSLSESLSYWVAIYKSRFDNMVSAFNELCQLTTKADGSDVSSRIINSLRPVIGEFASEEESDAAKSQPLSLLLSLPFLERAGYLGLSAYEIESIVIDGGDDVNEMREEFCRTQFLFSSMDYGSKELIGTRYTVTENGTGSRVRAPKASELETDDNGNFIGGGIAQVEEDYEWLVKTGRGDGIVFVPFEYFP
ncbi:vWA domain-containing protein [Lentilitoribacter sp. EG35]|uniref:vWA domain-containing protein n=1 Tax=Lentilitoribacter sp. EG35 TaxID=3234192 RepID=UPI003460E1EB